MKTHKRLKPGVIVQRIIVWTATLLFLFPFCICILMAVKSQRESANNLLSIPTGIEWNNFVQAWGKAKIAQSMLNSIIVTTLSVVIVVVVASMAGYAIGRQYKNKWFKFYETCLMAIMMIPFQTLMIPLYRMFKGLGLMNNLFGAIILIAAFNVPFAIVLIIGFVRTVPIELEEAAVIEGCGRFKLFWRIVIPLLKPILATVAILDTLWGWNEFNISLLILQKNAVKTIPLQQYVFFGEHASNYNMAFAAAVISMLPVVIFFIVAQKKIVAGMTAGAVKG